MRELSSVGAVVAAGGCECELQITRGLKAGIGLLLEAPCDDLLNGARDVRRQLRRLVMKNGVQRVDHTLPSERLLSRQRLIEHDSQGKDVGPMIDRTPVHLFRRHVAESTRA